MINITVRLESDFTSEYRDVEITKEELQQFACNKAKGMYMDGFYTEAIADDEINIKSQL